jgi:hypothetical protein
MFAGAPTGSHLLPQFLQSIAVISAKDIALVKSRAATGVDNRVFAYILVDCMVLFGL